MVFIVGGSVILSNFVQFMKTSSLISIFGCENKILTISMLFSLAANFNGVKYKNTNKKFDLKGKKKMEYHSKLQLF